MSQSQKMPDPLSKLGFTHRFEQSGDDVQAKATSEAARTVRVEKH